MLVEVASLPITAVATLVTAAITATATGTGAVFLFRRGQKDNSKTIAKLLEERDERDVTQREEREAAAKWRKHVEGVLFALKKGLGDDSPVHRLWPKSK